MEYECENAIVNGKWQRDARQRCAIMCVATLVSMQTLQSITMTFEVIWLNVEPLGTGCEGISKPSGITGGAACAASIAFALRAAPALVVLGR